MRMSQTVGSASRGSRGPRPNSSWRTSSTRRSRSAVESGVLSACRRSSARRETSAWSCSGSSWPSFFRSIRLMMARCSRDFISWKTCWRLTTGCSSAAAALRANDAPCGAVSLIIRSRSDMVFSFRLSAVSFYRTRMGRMGRIITDESGSAPSVRQPRGKFRLPLGFGLAAEESGEESAPLGFGLGRRREGGGVRAAGPGRDARGDLPDLAGDARRGLGLDERLAEVDRVDDRPVVARDEAHHALAQVALDLPEVEVDLLRPAVDDDPHLVARVAEAVEDGQRALRAADGRDVEGEDH